MNALPIRLLLELDPTAEPITGTLHEQPDGASTHFHGWLSLTQALEAARRRESQDTGRGQRRGDRDRGRADRTASPPTGPA
jgi:hypothetical protein